MWNICRSQCSTPRGLFHNEDHLSDSKNSSLFTSWFSSSSSGVKQSKIHNNSDLFCVDNLGLSSNKRSKSDSSSGEVVIFQQPSSYKDELSEIHQRIGTPLSDSMIIFSNSDKATLLSTKMSSQDVSSATTNKSNESEYKRSFIWNGSQSSVVREQPPTDHNIMSASQDSVLFNSNNNKAPVQVGHGSSVLFNMERSIDLKTSPEPERISEYHSKFKPFSDYVYVADEHRFRAQTSATKLASAAAEGSGADITPAAKAWFTEVEERVQEACKYRARSQNGSTPIDPEWKGTRTKNRDFLALALATQITIAEKRAQRGSRSSSAKPPSRSSRKELNSAPASLIDAPALTPKLRPIKNRTPTTTAKATSIDRNNNTVKGEAKVWIKKKKDDVSSETKQKEDKNEPKAVPRIVKRDPEPTENINTEVKAMPLHTTQIKSPEELTGVKSPPPEAWKISIEKGNLQWVNHDSPVNFDNNKTANNDSIDILKPVAINGNKN